MIVLRVVGVSTDNNLLLYRARDGQVVSVVHYSVTEKFFSISIFIIGKNSESGVFPGWNVLTKIGVLNLFDVVLKGHEKFSVIF